jgi:acyl-CoA reductase-like NAD-dependent aldehyde dehydrogenase
MKLLIGGELVDGEGEALEVEEPARGEVFATVAFPSDEQVDAAIGAARAAARGWAAMPSGERAELLHEVARRIRAAGHSEGWLMAPTVVTGAPAQTDLLREETFGPVAPIVPVRSLDEAIELASGTRFGLGANVYTRDLKTIFRCMREIKAGTVWFNDPLSDNDAGPFGGFKQSGLGRELGQEGLEAFQETKHVHIESELERKGWWYPYG